MGDARVLRESDLVNVVDDAGVDSDGGSVMNVSPLIGDLVMGGASGWAVGYFAKRFLKAVAFVVGGYLASLLYLSSRGYLIVDWEAIGVSADGILSKIGGLSLGVGVLGAGAVAGFALGWRSG